MSDPALEPLDGDVVTVNARKQLLSGNAPVLVLCATSSGLLSKRSRELIKSLRTDGARPIQRLAVHSSGSRRA